jgi:hypothetical protein
MGKRRHREKWSIQGYLFLSFNAMQIPLFLLNVFAKNEKVNISQAERNELKQMAGLLVKQYQKEKK